MKTLNEIMNTNFPTGNPQSHLYFRFTDSNVEERFFTYDQMKKYAEANYLKQYANDVHFGAFIYNSYCGCEECYDIISLEDGMDEEKCMDFVHDVLIEECGFSFSKLDLAALIYKWIRIYSENMYNDNSVNDGTVYYKKLSKDKSIVMLWESGYNNLIDRDDPLQKDDNRLVVSIRMTDSANIVNDWEYSIPGASYCSIGSNSDILGASMYLVNCF